MRTSRPWFRSQNQTWYVCIDGKQHNLGKDEEKAKRKFQALMEHGVKPGDYTVRQVVRAYWNWAKRNLAESTRRRRKDALESFAQSVRSTLKVDQLRALHVQKWLDTQEHKKTGKPLSPTTVCDYITWIKTTLNWAESMGYCDRNPIAKMPKPTPQIREAFLPFDAWPKLFAEVKDQEFRDYLAVMLATGARAEEITRFEAQHVHGDRFILPIIRSKGKKRSRVVYIPDDVLPIVQRLVEQYPTGPLFRNTNGEPWGKNSINCRFRRLKTKMKMPELCATVLRHSFAHHRLTSGQDALTVSKLMGHCDTRMISTRYGHLEASRNYLAEQANRAEFPTLPDTDEDHRASA